MRRAILHIDILEIRAVLLALTAFQVQLMGHTIALMIGNAMEEVFCNKHESTFYYFKNTGLPVG